MKAFAPVLALALLALPPGVTPARRSGRSGGTMQPDLTLRRAGRALLLTLGYAAAAFFVLFPISTSLSSRVCSWQGEQPKY